MLCRIPVLTNPSYVTKARFACLIVLQMMSCGLYSVLRILDFLSLQSCLRGGTPARPVHLPPTGVV